MSAADERDGAADGPGGRDGGRSTGGGGAPDGPGGGDGGRSTGGERDREQVVGGGRVERASVRDRAPVAGPRRLDRASLGRRLPVVVALATALGGVLALDGGSPGGGAAGTAPAGGSPATGRPHPFVAPAATAATSTWYCAAGTADGDGDADHTVVMANAGTERRTAAVTAYPGALAATADREGRGLPRRVTERVGIPPGGRAELRLGDLVEAPFAAALVEVDGGGVAVEHRVEGGHGADVAPCATAPADTWHLAWGATTRDTRDLVVVFNPFPSPTTVDALFTTEDGGRAPVRFQGLPVPARSVVAVDLGEDVTRSEHVAGTFTVRSGRVVIEHLQVYDGSLGTRGVALAAGAPRTSTTWVFADGEASAPSPGTPTPGTGDGEEQGDADGDAGHGDTTERIVVYNPGDERAEVSVELVPATGDGPAPQPFGLSVGPGDHEVVDHGAHERVAAGVAHATLVRSTNGVPVVAERVTVDRASPGDGAGEGSPPEITGAVSATVGATVAAPTWTFAGPAGGDEGGDTVSFAVFNPDPDRAVEVSLEVVSASVVGDALPDPVVVPPGGRAVVEAGTAVAARAPAMVVAADGPVVVERTVRAGDGRRIALSPGIATGTGVVPLDRVVGR